MKEDTVCGFRYEKEAHAGGAHRIAGVDEVGRGPLFGPVVAAAVILAPGAKIVGLNDSKKLKEKQREALEPEIKLNAISWAIAEVDAETIDRINIRRASLEAMRRAVSQLPLSPDCLLIDGRDTIDWDCPQKTIIGGDGLSFSIAAASVLAKVYRDRLLVEFDRQYPGYGLARHKGYGTAEHLAALNRLGPTPQHRRSFHPVAQSLSLFDQKMATEEPADPSTAEETEAVLVELAAEPEPRYACPCCGFLTLPAPPPGTFDLCEVCWWEDDPVQFRDPTYEGGANAPSLNQARQNFATIAVSDPAMKGHERPPRPEEIPPAGISLRLF
jgi:ribonuclease HII